MKKRIFRITKKEQELLLKRREKLKAKDEAENETSDPSQRKVSWLDKIVRFFGFRLIDRIFHGVWIQKTKGKMEFKIKCY